MPKHAAAEPSQTAYPWRTVARTALQALIGFAAIVPFIVDASGLQATGLIGAAVAISSAVTRIMAIKEVNAWLMTYMPFLAADPVIREQ